MAGQKVKGLQRIVNAFRFSLAGFKAVWNNEAAFRQELFLLIIATPVALTLGHSALEKLALIGSIILILLMELINSAIEAVVDRIGLEQHELSGRAKDIGSATVLFAFFWAIIVWVTLLF